MLAREIALTLAIRPRQMNGALPLDVPDDLRHRVFRWYRNQHVHMIEHHMAVLYPAFLLLGKPAQHLAEVSPNVPEQRFLAAFRNENDMIFAVPFRVV